MALHDTLRRVTDRVIQRSTDSRARYLQRLDAQKGQTPRRGALACGNLAHGFAACAPDDKAALATGRKSNIAIVSAYNDMLSAHQPFERFPALIKQAAHEAGVVAQFAGGVPAMCDGVTQGRDGMELSLFSRDVIAQSTAIALSHDMFDAALYLGVCDKIVPGLLIGALSFGHLPAIFVPAGPMPSGLSNPEKAKVRQLYAEGKATRDDLLEAESKSYHSPGTCTFYGTANSNQMLMEIMGLHLPGSSFINPNTELRDALTVAATQRVAQLTEQAGNYTPIGRLVDERSIVNAIVGLLATGGSTNHTLHLVAMARAAGIRIDWQDFSDLSGAVPLLARVYPNGVADVNHFHAAGGLQFLISTLLDAGLLHGDVTTVADGTAQGRGLDAYRHEAWLQDGKAAWRPGTPTSADTTILRPAADPFDPSGGIRLLTGNAGRAIIKVSAVKPQHRIVEAPAIVFEAQDEMLAAFKRGELERDFIAVVRFQGPAANGMPELHKLTPQLGILQDKGFKVALVTDGRMSGASGKVPAAIHLTPEALKGGSLARIRTGDIVRLDGETGTLDILVDAAEFAARPALTPDLTGNSWGTGRNLFGGMRAHVTGAEEGAHSFGEDFA
ncbi:phosphogluconate dehydratase [Nitrospirillum iridis]|uniref:Phosphogluconate dehydratase n=1 Tax=Nitrospirillum iridis TaxID=765888 RepID=A0A7X0ECQ2_9PROT|nr:phosphogluconate dehydratase [Nitrospirillum iridis]MBB6251340.1 phosphogluconate dehydratase [Nitrospirillum iridis]